MIETFAPNDRPIVTSIVTTLSQTFTNERSDERIAVGGTANLARFGSDFDTAIKPVLEAIEEQVVLLKLLGEATAAGSDGPHRHRDRQRGPARARLSSPSAYGRTTRRSPRSAPSGPTRMDYPGTMAAVGAVARYVGRIAGRQLNPT